MIRMLLKELDERRWLALLWGGLVLLALVLFQEAYHANDAGHCAAINILGNLLPCPSCGGWHLNDMARALDDKILWLTGIFAAYAGCTAYASELKEGRALFLHGRPMRWLSIFFAKVAFAAVVIVVPLVLVVLCSYVFMPAPYRSFQMGIDYSTLLPFLWLPLLIYLFTVSASLLVGGPVGGVLTLAAVAILVFAQALGIIGGLEMWGPDINSPDVSERIKNLVTTVNLAAIAAPVLAYLVAGSRLIRFGITLTQSERIRRFVLTYLVANPLAMLVIFLGVLLATPAITRSLQQTPAPPNPAKTIPPTYVRLSPNMRYAYLQYGNTNAVIESLDEPRQRVAIPTYPNPGDPKVMELPHIENWVGDVGVFSGSHRTIYFVNGTVLKLPLLQREIGLHHEYTYTDHHYTTSPDQRWLLGTSRSSEDGKEGIAFIIDLQNRKVWRSHVKLLSYYSPYGYWVDNNTYAQPNWRTKETITITVADFLKDAVDITNLPANVDPATSLPFRK